MKKILAIAVCGFFFSCDSTQKGEDNYTDSASAKTDTTSIPYTTTNSDSAKSDSTVKDSTYHK